MRNPFRFLQKINQRQPDHHHDSPRSTAQLGEYGERLATEYLRQHGYRLVATNYTAPVGRSLNGRIVTGEIDIIAYDETKAETKAETSDETDYLPTLCFVEVKTRSQAELALPQAAVDLRKQRQILRAAAVYRRILGLSGEKHRYDVVSIIARQGAPPEITLLKDYFSEASFSRSFQRSDREFY